LFADDTRFLSRWVFTVDGKRPTCLSTDDVQYYETQFFLAPTSGTVYVDSDLSIFRHRVVEQGFREELSILNHSAKPVSLDLRIEAGADFADLFEVKDALKKKGEHYRRAEADRLVLGYRRDTYVRETCITAPGADFDELGLGFRAEVPPQGEWSASISVLVSGAGIRKNAAPTGPQRKKKVAAALASAPKLFTDWLPLAQTYERSIVDLAALRFFPLIAPEGSLPAAGLPWFMAVFGRDSILTSLQALPFDPELAATTLKVLAARQGTRLDPFRDEEPGKILHEARAGEMTRSPSDRIRRTSAPRCDAPLPGPPR
jgi:glycogen debranching enzyme